MTLGTLSIQERAQYIQYKQDIEIAFWAKVESMVAIEEGKLYREDFHSFADWLLICYPQLTADGNGITGATWRSWKSAWQAQTLAVKHGIDLKNQHAGRVLNRAQKHLREYVVITAARHQKMLTGYAPDKLTAAMITTATQIIGEVLETAAKTGCVDTGDGMSTAFDMAVNVALQEQVLRRNQHIIERAKARGKRERWSDPVAILDCEDEYSLFLFLKDIAPGKMIEIKWRVVEVESESIK